MSKSTKRLLAMLPYADQEQRIAFKHAMIGAQHSPNVAPKTSKDKMLKETEAD
jgi:hypothetical protein